MKKIEQLQNIVKNFCVDREWDQFHNPKDLAIGLSTEANELLDIFRFKSEVQMIYLMKDEEKRECISDELGDIFFFLLRFAQIYDFDLENCLKIKIQKNEKKYPVEIVKGNNLKYSEY